MKSSPGGQAFFFLVPTHADIQTAVIYLRPQRVNAAKWSNSSFQTAQGTLTYAQIFAQMAAHPAGRCRYVDCPLHSRKPMGVVVVGGAPSGLLDAPGF